MTWYPAFGLRKVLLALSLVIAIPILYVVFFLVFGLKCAQWLFQGANFLLIFFVSNSAGIDKSFRMPVVCGLGIFFFVLLLVLTWKPFMKIMNWLGHSLFPEGHLLDLLK